MDILNVRGMSDSELLQKEKDVYEMWVRYTTKSVCGSSFGLVSAITTLGSSTIVTGPVVVRRVYWAVTYSKQSKLCKAEIKRRGLVSLKTNYGKLIVGIAKTVSISTACALIPFADGAEDAVAAAAELALLGEKVGGAVVEPPATRSFLSIAVVLVCFAIVCGAAFTAFVEMPVYGIVLPRGVLIASAIVAFSIAVYSSYPPKKK